MPLEVTFILYFQQQPHTSHHPQHPPSKKKIAAKHNVWVASTTNVIFTCDVERFPICENQMLHFKAL